MRSLTSALTTAVNAAPMTTATARSTTLPRRMNSRNSLRVSVIRDMAAKQRGGSAVPSMPGMDLSLFFAGTAGSVPTARRGLPATLLRRGGDRLLFDCGEGTQRQLLRTVGLPDMQAVFLTHLHADHWLGLPGMLKSFELRDRDAPLTVYGPPGTADAHARDADRLRPPALPVRASSTSRPATRSSTTATRSPPFNVRHRGRAFGYAIVEEPRPGRFDAELRRAWASTFGPDFGRLQRGEIGQRRAPRAGRRARARRAQDRPLGRHGAVRDARASPPTRPTSSSTRRPSPTRSASARCRPATRPRARRPSSPREADVRLLALTHVSTRYAGGEIRDEARAIFERTEVPRDFDIVEVPFPEKGEPELQRYDPQRASAAGAGAEAPAPSSARRAGERMTGPPRTSARACSRGAASGASGRSAWPSPPPAASSPACCSSPSSAAPSPSTRSARSPSRARRRAAPVPALVGQRLDVALDRLESAGLEGRGAGRRPVRRPRRERLEGRRPGPVARRAPVAGRHRAPRHRPG